MDILVTKSLPPELGVKYQIPMAFCEWFPESMAHKCQDRLALHLGDENFRNLKENSSAKKI